MDETMPGERLGLSDLRRGAPTRAAVHNNFCDDCRKKPFDLIFERAKTEKWSALADDFRTLLQMTCLPEMQLLAQDPVRGISGQ
jgi:hypothetical protein